MQKWPVPASWLQQVESQRARILLTTFAYRGASTKAQNQGAHAANQARMCTAFLTTFAHRGTTTKAENQCAHAANRTRVCTAFLTPSAYSGTTTKSQNQCPHAANRIGMCTAIINFAHILPYTLQLDLLRVHGHSEPPWGCCDNQLCSHFVVQLLTRSAACAQSF